MLRFHALVFSDYIHTAAPVYTGVQHVKVLAQGDQIGLFAICDQAATGGTLTAAIEHSTDGMNWSQKNATPEINGVALAMGQPTPVYGGETYPTSHSLEFVRVRLSVALSRGVRVRLYAAVRDRMTGRYTSCGCAGDEEPARAKDADARATPARQEVAALLASRPERALAELRRRLAETPAQGSLRERVKEALAAMEERGRVLAAGFLEKVAALHPETRQEILRRGSALP